MAKQLTVGFLRLQIKETFTLRFIHWPENYLTTVRNLINIVVNIPIKNVHFLTSLYWAHFLLSKRGAKFSRGRILAIARVVGNTFEFAPTWFCRSFVFLDACFGIDFAIDTLKEKKGLSFLLKEKKGLSFHLIFWGILVTQKTCFSLRDAHMYVKMRPYTHTHTNAPTRTPHDKPFCAREHASEPPHARVTKIHLHVHACTYEYAPTRTTHTFVHAITCQWTPTRSRRAYIHTRALCVRVRPYTHATRVRIHMHMYIRVRPYRHDTRLCTHARVSEPLHARATYICK